VPHCLTLSESPTGGRLDRCPSYHARYADGLVAPDSLNVCACGKSYRIPLRGTQTPSARLLAVRRPPRPTSGI